MEIVTFFSFKGGVGRTQALLNTACEFAQRGKKVLLIDFDVHAPGLSLMDCMQPEDADDPAVKSRPGVLEFFEWLVLFDEALRRGETRPDPINLAACAYVPQVASKLKEGSGFFKLVPAASLSSDCSNAGDYSDRIHSIDSPLAEVIRRTHRQGEKNPVVEQIRSQFESLAESERPDVIFIDARTGITGIADLFLTRSSDRIVLVTGLNQQNLWGLKSTLRDIEHSVETAVWLQRITIVVSPVPMGEHELAGERLAVILKILNERIDLHEREMFGAIGLVPEPIEIPYDAQLALLDDPILLRHPRSLPSTRYCELADRLGGELEPLQFRSSVDEKLSQRHNSETPAEHPLTRVLSWDAGFSPDQVDGILRVLRPKIDPDKPYPGWLNHVLNFLANYLALGKSDEEECRRFVSDVPQLPFAEREALLNTARRDRQRISSMPKEDWASLAFELGKARVRWIRLFVPSHRTYSVSWDQLIDNGASSRNWERYRSGVARALKRAGDFAEGLVVLKKSEALAEVRGDQRELSEILRMKGDFLWRLHRHDEAQASYSSALKIYREIGDSGGEGRALTSLGELLEWTGNIKGALTRLREALQIFRVNGDRLGEANTLYQLGDLFFHAGSMAEAHMNYESALRAQREIGDRLGEANSLQSLGRLRMQTGRLSDARANFEKAIAIYRELKALLGEANTLKSSGHLLMWSAHLNEAATCFNEALQIYRKIKERFGEAGALRALGDVLVRISRLEDADTHYSQALMIHREINERSGIAESLRSLGDLRVLLDSFPHARRHYDEALIIYREITEPLGEAVTLRSLGNLYMREGSYDFAQTHLGQALTIFRSIEERVGEANTLQLLGELAIRRESLDEAKACLDEGLTIFREIKEPLGEANTLRSLAMYHLARGEMGGCQDKINMCLARYGKLSDDDGLWETNLVVARVRAKEARLGEARSIALQVSEDARAKAFYLLAREAEQLAEVW